MQTQQQKDTGCGLTRLIVSLVLLVPLLPFSYFYFTFLIYESSGRDSGGLGGVVLMPMLAIMLLTALIICILAANNIMKHMYMRTSIASCCICILVALAGVISFLRFA